VGYIFCPKELTQRLNGEEIFTVRADIFPFTVPVDAASGNDAMQMRAQAQDLSPPHTSPPHHCPK